MRSVPLVAAFTIALVAPACRDEADGFALTTRGGTYRDGSGRAGLAILATLRDASGSGPSRPWNATIRDGTGYVASATYARGGAGSYEVWRWPEVAARDLEPYTVAASDGDATATAAFSTGVATVLPQPEAVLAADSSRIDWAAVPGAESYACRVHVAGALHLETLSREPGCDLSGLPPGGYTASVLAFSADLVALADDHARTPALPERLDIAEAELAFVRPDPGSDPLVVLAAGGAFDDGTSGRTLAVWLSIRSPDGTPTASSWNVSVVGPGLPPEAPLSFTYHANFPRRLVWSRAVPATPGTYFVTATAGSSVFAAFSLGSPAGIPFVLDAAASPRPSGSARVTWTPVEGARAYLVSAWDSTRGALAASFWVPAPPAQFPGGSFVPGVAYDVFVAATDADMSGATAPGQFAVSEYPYLPASFVAE